MLRARNETGSHRKTLTFTRTGRIYNYCLIMSLVSEVNKPFFSTPDINYKINLLPSLIIGKNLSSNEYNIHFQRDGIVKFSTNEQLVSFFELFPR